MGEHVAFVGEQKCVLGVGRWKCEYERPLGRVAGY